MSYCSALRLVCITLAVWIGGALPASSATRHVVLLFDERVELPGLAALEAEFVKTLASSSSDHIETYRENMDTSRFDSDSYRTLLKDYLREKYANKKIDVAVAALVPALEFLLKHGGAIFPGTPIVFCGIDRRELGERLLPPHVHGVLLKREFAPTLELALGLHPDTKHIAVVAGTSEFDTRLLEQARQQFGVYESRLTFRYLTAAPLQKLLIDLAGLPPQTIVLFTTLFQDGAGESFVPHNVVPLVSAAASAPVYGFLDQYLDRGIVGGSLYSTSTQGAEAAKLVLQLLAGSERTQPALTEVSDNKVQFDWRQMQRWNIAENRLPPGSEMHFRQQGVWDLYRWQIVSLCAVSLLPLILGLVLINEHRSRIGAEMEANQRMVELAHLHRHSTAGEMSAAIAHELNQPLGAILNNAGTAEIILNSPTPDLAVLKELVANIRRDDTRAGEIIRRLRTLVSNKKDTFRACDLNELAQEALAVAGIQARAAGVTIHNNSSSGPWMVKGDAVQLQQVVLNLALNAIEATRSFSRARRDIVTRIAPTDNMQVEFSIHDFGPGIPEEQLKQVFDPFFTTKRDGMGMGLSLARTIIEAHDGTIWAENGPVGGGTFRFRLPRITTTPRA